MWDEFDSSTNLASAVSDTPPDSSVNIPQSQPSFDTAGSPAGTAKDILTSAKQVVTTVGSDVGAIANLVKDLRANSAIQDNNRKVALQQSNTAAAVANYQNRTQLAQAQAAFQRAAGVITSNPMLTIGLALVGLYALSRIKA